MSCKGMNIIFGNNDSLVATCIVDNQSCACRWRGQRPVLAKEVCRLTDWTDNVESLLWALTCSTPRPPSADIKYLCSQEGPRQHFTATNSCVVFYGELILPTKRWRGSGLTTKSVCLGQAMPEVASQSPGHTTDSIIRIWIWQGGKAPGAVSSMCW